MNPRVSTSCTLSCTPAMTSLTKSGSFNDLIMYVSVVTTLLGEAIFFRSLAVLIEAGVFILVAHLFVMCYEEPALRRQFGESYERYLQTVGRWIPRFRS